MMAACSLPLFAMLVFALPGAPLQRAHKVSARVNRLAALLRRAPLTTAEFKELSSLRREDTYDEGGFSPAHAAFKQAHNVMFVDLAGHCSKISSVSSNGACMGSDSRCFYLDGPGGCTTATLVASGFERSQLFTANWHPTTCDALRASPHSLAATNVALSPADEALRDGLFARVGFSAIYMDGCGGAVAPLVLFIDALFSEARASLNPSPMAFGFTLTDAEPTGRAMADREVDVHRALVSACKRSGFVMSHVSDAPERFGVDASTSKRDGSTLTCWLVCERHVELAPPRADTAAATAAPPSAVSSRASAASGANGVEACAPPRLPSVELS